MMGFVPCCTPQAFSRMVVLPALARPMMRIRKWGHLYLSFIICSALYAWVKLGYERNVQTDLMHQHWWFLPSFALSGQGLQLREEVMAERKKAGRGKGVVFRKLGVASAKIRVGLKEESLILMCQARAWESKRRPGAIRLSCNCTQSNGQRVSREQEVVCHRVVMRDVWCMDPRARIWNLLSFFAHLGIWALASYN